VILLAFLSSVIIHTTVKMVRAEEVRAQHAEGIFVDFDLVLPQMFPKEVPHQLTSSSAGLSV